MQALNCLIIEDEPLAADILREYIAEIPSLHLKGVCTDALSAMEVLRTQKIDVLFVDINLPKINGLDFIKTLKNNYAVILTTAYHEFALEAFNLNAIDYLLKPIEFSRFLQAIQKALEVTKSHYTSPAIPQERKFYFFNVAKKQVKIYADEILYIESLKEYVKIQTLNQKFITKFALSDLEKLLADSHFLRVHKSFIVNVEKIKSYSALEMEIAHFVVPIGRTYKAIVEQFLKE
ncbi:MAG: LytR/AlgR family response regulator transcription factor [Bacteroidia bacterium]